MGFFIGRRVQHIIILCVALAMVGFYFLCISGDFEILRRPPRLLCDSSLPCTSWSSIISSKKRTVSMSWVNSPSLPLFGYLEASLKARLPRFSGLPCGKLSIRRRPLKRRRLTPLPNVSQNIPNRRRQPLIMSLETVFAVWLATAHLGKS